MIKPTIGTKKSLCQTNLPHLHHFLFLVSKRPNIDAIYRYVSKNVATNVDIDLLKLKKALMESFIFFVQSNTELQALKNYI